MKRPYLVRRQLRFVCKLFLGGYLFLWCLPIFGQNQENENQGRFRYLEIEGHSGGYLYSGPDLEESGYLESGYGAFNMKMGWQSSPSSDWAGYFNYPSYGIGFYSGFLGNDEVFGQPNALYGFIGFPLSRPGKKFSASLTPSFGLTYNLEPYDPIDNPLNDAIGARMAVYFNIDYGFSYRFTRELDFKGGIDFGHFSNGRTFVPNWGLNMFGLNFGIRYYYNADQFKRNPEAPLLPARMQRPPKTKLSQLRENHISVYLAGGLVQNEADTDNTRQYGTFSGVLEYSFRFNQIHGISAGLDYFFDNSLRQYNNASDRDMAGVHLGYDFMFYKFTIKGQIGVYLTDNRGKGGYYMRPALRYNLSDKFFAQIGLKTTDGGAADWVEYGIGFKPFRW